MRKVCVIPARLNSSRLKHKVLQIIEGKALVERVFVKAVESGFFDQVVVAIDDEQIGAYLEKVGIEYFMTSPDCPSGTQRLIELVEDKKIEGDFFVNWQADEPMLPQGLLIDFFAKVEISDADVVTVQRQIQSKEHVDSPHVVKVVTDHGGKALYFSRSPIPFYREEVDFADKKIFEHVGLYGFFAHGIKKIAKMQDNSFLESCEKLEQLRFLEYGLSIDVATTQFASIGIDTPQDLERVRKYFKKESQLFL